MQQLLINVDDSVADKFFWLLKHFDKKEVEIIDFDPELEIKVQEGLDAPVSSQSHEEVFANLRKRYVKQ